ncbi:VanW family protein [Syntrophomonas curvata]
MLLLKGFYFIRLDQRVWLLLTFFISIPLLANWVDQVERHFFGVAPGVIMAGRDFSGMLPEEVAADIEYLAIKHQKLPREPGLDKRTGQITGEATGVVIDVPGSVNKVLNAAEGQHLELETITVYPRYSRRDLENANQILGSYESWISGSYQRYSNIELASSCLNNSVIWPGEVFSFNQTVGPRTVERGFMPAPVILMGARELDYGGGVCQVSSTLYNTVLASGLKITERHQHSLPVSYVPAGSDAAVDYAHMDLRFKNTSQDLVIIKAGVSRGRVWVQLWGGEKK